MRDYCTCIAKVYQQHQPKIFTNNYCFSKSAGVLVAPVRMDDEFSCIASNFRGNLHLWHWEKQFRLPCSKLIDFINVPVGINLICDVKPPLQTRGDLFCVVFDFGWELFDMQHCCAAIMPRLWPSWRPPLSIRALKCMKSFSRLLQLFNSTPIIPTEWRFRENSDEKQAARYFLQMSFWVSLPALCPN